MFSQEVLKVGLHRYHEVLDILKQKCSFYFFFYAWQNLCEQKR